jgi:8-oxo-dGTP diphosphatase
MVSLLLIVKENRFLFCKRRPDDEVYGGYWGLPGGTVEENETPVEGMIREVEEELGITISDFRFLDKYPYEGNKIMNIYVRDNNDFDPSTIRLNEEHTEYKFFTYYEVQNNSINFVPTNTQILLDYIKTQS